MDRGLTPPSLAWQAARAHSRSGAARPKLDRVPEACARLIDLAAEADARPTMRGALWRAAVASGDAPTLLLLEPDATAWSPRVCAGIAAAGRADGLRLARERGCPWDAETCRAAAANGHLDRLRWARENGCAWDEAACCLARLGGHLDCLRWARENGCPWDERTCGMAALLECARWARENGCPWASDAARHAGRKGHSELLR